MEIVLKNYMEDCVRELLPAVIKDSEMCKCDRCLMDITAYALNQLPPRYAVSERGYIHSKIDAMHVQFDADVITAIMNGAKVISKNPRHSS